jgi:hypothetical protein
MALPMLCRSHRHDAYTAHEDRDGSCVVWVFHADGREVVFLRASVLLAFAREKDGKTFGDLLLLKPHVECCRMISRDLLRALRMRRPDYCVIVDDGAIMSAPLTVAHGMDAFLAQAHEGGPSVERVVALAGEGNLVGAKLAALMKALKAAAPPPMRAGV